MAVVSFVDESARSPHSSFAERATLQSRAILMKMAGGLAFAASLMTIGPEHRSSEITGEMSQERMISNALYAAYGGYVEVSCVPDAKADKTQKDRQGWVNYLGPFVLPTAFLRQSTCDEISAFSKREDRDVSYEQARSIMTAVHEWVHIMHNDKNEARVECEALQRVDAFATTLNSRTKGVSLAALEVYHGQRPAKYVSTECRKGGELDASVGHFAYFPFDPNGEEMGPYSYVPVLSGASHPSGHRLARKAVLQ